MQVTEKTEAFMEDARRLASTAARLEHSKEEVGRQVGKSIIREALMKKKR